MREQPSQMLTPCLLTGLQGPGVHLYTTVPFGEFNDNRRRTRLEQELPKGYSKRGSECDSLRRVTFLYSNRDNPAFTDTEQQCVAVVLVSRAWVVLNCCISA